MITTNIVADSISPAGKRITTLELVYPRFIHAEVMTHRAFSRNASSSRAIPVARASQMALDEMVFPVRWGLNQAGMQAKGENLGFGDMQEAELLWKYAAERCANTAIALSNLGLHKQWANRMIEWFSNIRVLVTATEWDNFFELRDHEDAQDEIRILAQTIRKAMDDSAPVETGMHLPYITKEEFDLYLDDWTGDLLSSDSIFKMSAARCCRVSYLKHDGTTPNIEEDLALFERLAGSRPMHSSPLEHQAFCNRGDTNTVSNNFRGWKQFRQYYEESLKENDNVLEK